MQARLLRTLQNGEIQRLGDDRPRRVDVRIVAATNRSLRDLVRAGDFRADLYHRLSVYPIPIPPLRDRGNDVLLLAGRYLELNRARLGLRSLRLSPEAEEMMRRYRWPGNVRELEHVISRAAIKAVSHGASRNEIVTLGAAADLSDGDMPSAPLEDDAGADAASATPPLRAAVDASPAPGDPPRPGRQPGQLGQCGASAGSRSQQPAQARPPHRPEGMSGAATRS